jgi:hypothetical protein
MAYGHPPATEEFAISVAADPEITQRRRGSPIRWMAYGPGIGCSLPLQKKWRVNAANHNGTAIATRRLLLLTINIRREDVDRCVVVMISCGQAQGLHCEPNQEELNVTVLYLMLMSGPGCNLRLRLLMCSDINSRGRQTERNGHIDLRRLLTPLARRLGKKLKLTVGIGGPGTVGGYPVPSVTAPLPDANPSESPNLTVCTTRDVGRPIQLDPQLGSKGEEEEGNVLADPIGSEVAMVVISPCRLPRLPE